MEHLKVNYKPLWKSIVLECGLNDIVEIEK